jgi:hypothetical protein
MRFLERVGHCDPRLGFLFICYRATDFPEQDAKVSQRQALATVRLGQRQTQRNHANRKSES